eukprot:TRINITY_DN5221_c0_g1_i2.p1 TRINITY_DN5221_c0_g1~~TRINITY_DN5221_c0_g1_i2.p1  ORF type:complete len:263 (+),score=38.03 TRINITY_DN5221_c0_g1_i2:198-986(+)
MSVVSAGAAACCYVHGPKGFVLSDTTSRQRQTSAGQTDNSTGEIGSPGEESLWVPLTQGEPSDMWQCDYCEAKFYCYSDTEKHEGICPSNPVVRAANEAAAAAWTVPTDYPTHVSAHKYHQSTQANRQYAMTPEFLSRDGGTENGFWWCQDQSSCTVSLVVLPGTRPADIKVEVRSRVSRQEGTGRKVSLKSLKVAAKGHQLLEGDLAYVIVAPEENEELDWELKDFDRESGERVLRVTLEKKNRKQWTKVMRGSHSQISKN